jgi:hypothetical protein
LTPELGEVKKVIDEPTHLLGTILYAAKILRRIRIDAATEMLGQDLCEALDLPNWCAQVV